MESLSFKSWLEDVNTIAAATQNNANKKAADMNKNIKMRGAKNIAVNAAAAAAAKNQNPTQAAKQAIVNQIKNGQLDLKDIGKLMPE